MGKTTRKTGTNGKRTLEQRENYHKAALEKLAISKQIQALKARQKSLK
jgi:hypothetical protein